MLLGVLPVISPVLVSNWPTSNSSKSSVCFPSMVSVLLISSWSILIVWPAVCMAIGFMYWSVPNDYFRDNSIFYHAWLHYFHDISNAVCVEKRAF